MHIFKVSDSKYINLEWMTYIERTRNGSKVYYNAGAGELARFLYTDLDEQETACLVRWLDYLAKNTGNPSDKEPPPPE